jgi:hypothetical protein
MGMVISRPCDPNLTAQITTSQHRNGMQRQPMDRDPKAQIYLTEQRTYGLIISVEL